MSKSRRTRTNNGGRPDGRRAQIRRISVRSVRRETPDVQKLGRAIIRMAVLEAAAERAAQNDLVDGAQVVEVGTSAQPTEKIETDEADHDQ